MQNNDQDKMEIKISELRHGDLIEWKTPRPRKISSSEFSNIRIGRYVGVIKKGQSLVEAFPWVKEISQSYLKIGQGKTESSTNLRFFIEVERRKGVTKLESLYFAPAMSQVLKVEGKPVKGFIVDI